MIWSLSQQSLILDKLFVCHTLLLNRQLCVTMIFQLGREEWEQTDLSLNFRSVVWVLLPYPWLQEPSCTDSSGHNS